MDEFIKFNSIEELYRRITPALRCKVDEFSRLKINCISEYDLWLYLVNNKWFNKEDLRLHDLVSDIFMVNVDEVINYKKINRK